MNYGSHWNGLVAYDQENTSYTYTRVGFPRQSLYLAWKAWMCCFNSSGSIQASPLCWCNMNAAKRLILLSPLYSASALLAPVIPSCSNELLINSSLSNS
jgi:hypothetical protein